MLEYYISQKREKIDSKLDEYIKRKDFLGTYNFALLEEERDFGLGKNEYFNKKIEIKKNYTNNFDLEEILETERGRESNIEGIPFYQINISDKPVSPRDGTYFQTTAENILGAIEEEKVLALKEALREFQARTQSLAFGTSHLLKYLKQSWTITPSKTFIDKFAFWKNYSHSKQPDSSKRIAIAPTNSETENPLREISKEELGKYSLVLDMQREGSHFGKKFGTKYFDTPFNFCLAYEGNLIASVGFTPETGRIYIQQIQGIKGNHERLSPFKWERALIDYATQWAQTNGINQVSITSVKNNKWAHRVGHLTQEQGKMLYDVTAKRCGFKQGADKDYHIYFEQQSSNEPRTRSETISELEELKVA